MKKKFGENYLRKEEKESSKKGMNKKNELDKKLNNEMHNYLKFIKEAWGINI